MGHMGHSDRGKDRQDIPEITEKVQVTGNLS